MRKARAWRPTMGSAHRVAWPPDRPRGRRTTHPLVLDPAAALLWQRRCNAAATHIEQDGKLFIPKPKVILLNDVDSQVLVTTTAKRRKASSADDLQSAGADAEVALANHKKMVASAMPIMDHSTQPIPEEAADILPSCVKANVMVQTAMTSGGIAPSLHRELKKAEADQLAEEEDWFPHAPFCIRTRWY